MRKLQRWRIETGAIGIDEHRHGGWSYQRSGDRSHTTRTTNLAELDLAIVSMMRPHAAVTPCSQTDFAALNPSYRAHAPSPAARRVAASRNHNDWRLACAFGSQLPPLLL